MTTRTTAIIYALIVAWLFATHAVFVRFLMASLDPLAFAGLRGLGAGLLLACLQAEAIKQKLSYSLVLKVLIIAACGYGLNQVLLVEGLVRAGPADAALINSTIPLVTALATAWFKLERLGRTRLLGVLLGMLALFVFIAIVQRDNLRFDLVGDLFLIGNVLAFGLALTLLRLLTRSIPSGVIAALMLIIGGSLLMAISAQKLPQTLLSAFSTPTMALSICFDMLICTALAWLLYIKAIATLGATQTAAFSYLQAPLSALMTWIALSEQPPWLLAPVTVFLVIAVWMVAQATPLIQRRS